MHHDLTRKKYKILLRETFFKYDTFDFSNTVESYFLVLPGFKETLKRNNTLITEIAGGQN